MRVHQLSFAIVNVWDYLSFGARYLEILSFFKTFFFVLFFLHDCFSLGYKHNWTEADLKCFRDTFFIARHLEDVFSFSRH